MAEFVAERVRVKERRMPAGTATMFRAEAVETLARVHKGNAVLAKVVAKGVAFHNAGAALMLNLFSSLNPGSECRV